MHPFSLPTSPPFYSWTLAIAIISNVSSTVYLSTSPQAPRPGHNIQLQAQVKTRSALASHFFAPLRSSEPVFLKLHSVDMALRGPAPTAPASDNLSTTNGPLAQPCQFGTHDKLPGETCRFQHATAARIPPSVVPQRHCRHVLRAGSGGAQSATDGSRLSRWIRPIILILPPDH
jgi:hypothetical protein